jgi:hypothetical protein
LLEHLIVSAREEGIDRLAGFVPADNSSMLDLCLRPEPAGG